jgi:hypothetical protein
MITSPEVKATTYPAYHATQITWDYMLKGERSQLNSCSIRLGTGKDVKEVTWTRRLDVRGDYKNGHVDEYLEKDDLLKTKEGEILFGQFLFVPSYVYDEKAEKITKNHEGEMGVSKIFPVVSS